MIVEIYTNKGIYLNPYLFVIQFRISLPDRMLGYQVHLHLFVVLA